MNIIRQIAKKGQSTFEKKLNNIFFIKTMGLIYEIEHPEVQKYEFGELNKPFLYHITSGQRNGTTVIFHSKIGNSYHQSTIS